MAEGGGEGAVTKAKSFNTELQPIIWKNVISITIFHVTALYALWLAFTHNKAITILWGLLLGNLSGIGVTAGAHRLWSHKAYKAKWPLRIILMILYTVAGQNSIYDWVRDHRVHHKFSETDADPHNAKRGFFFAHVGWLMQRKHPDVLEKGRQVDMSDITEDPILAFHTKYFLPLKIIFCFILPIAVPIYLWNETLYYSILFIGFLRYVLGLNFTWLVNSAAHLWGNKPYDRTINPSENKVVAFLAMGEGWHNYHHVFPWDYKTAELGNYSLNLTTAFIDFFAWVGWAYDLKSVSPDMLKKRILRTGDGSHSSVESDDNKLQ